MLTIEQAGEDSIVTIYGETRKIAKCNALKLAATMFNNGVDRYTPEEMYDFGFEPK